MPKTYEPIATTTLTTNQASVTFSSIPATYTDLILIVAGRRDNAGNDLLRYRLNGDSGSNYSRTLINGDGTSATSGRSTNQTYAYAGDMSNSVISNHIIQFLNYSNTTTNKTILSRGNKADSYTDAEVNLWSSTAAINSIVLEVGGVNFLSGSTFTLYGIASA